MHTSLARHLRALNGGGGLTAWAWYSVNILTGPHSIRSKRAADQVDGGDLVILACSL